MEERDSMSSTILSHVNSLFNSVTYLFGNVVVDPGDKQEWVGVECVLLTHCHFDHIYGLNELMEQSPTAKVYTNAYGAKMLTDVKLNMSKYHDLPFVFSYYEQIIIVDDGDKIDLGNGLTATIYATPGHNPSCLTYAVGSWLFTGDAHIPGVKVVTNLPHADKAQAAASEQRILSLASNRTIFPGHAVSSLNDGNNHTFFL